MLVKRTATIFVVLLFSSLLPAENQEKAQKKVLEAHAKAIIAEAKTLEKSGQLVEARVKYAESQAMLETRDAVDAIKHLDDEIHKHAKDVLNESRKLYEAHKYKEAAVALEQGAKTGTSQGVLSFNLALSYFQLGERNKAVESLDTAIRDTADPKEKARFEQLLTSFTTGENAAAANDNDRNRVAQFNHLADSLGFDASLEDDEGTKDDRPFSESDLPSPHLTEATLKSTGAVTPPSIIFDRANCAEINGRPAEAVRLLQQYLEAAPHALDADGVQPRVAELQSLIALPEPHGIEIRRLYASASGYLTERKYDRALAALLKAKSLVAEFSLTYWKVALLYEAMDNLDLARENFTHYAQLTSDPTAKEAATLHLSRLEEKKSRYEEEVSAAEDILSDLFNRGMNLTFNLDESRSSIRAHRARIKKKQDQKKDKNRIGGFAIPYAYAQQELGRASEHLQVALALFPLGPEANELMGLVFLQANDGRAAIKNFDAVASQGLPVAFYAEMRGHKLDHAVKCELARDQVRLIFLSTYDKKGNPTAPDKPAGDDGLGDLTLAPSDDRAAVDSLNLSLADIHKVETNKGLLTFKLAKQEFTLAPIYLPSYTPVEGPPARRFANNYTRLFIRYPGLEDAKLGAEGMTGGEKFVMGYKLASAGLNIATSLNPIGAIQATQSAISIARIIHSAMASMNVSFASWERSVDDQQQLLAGPSFKAIPIEPMNLAFVHDLK
jgi:tetratricopeptide (TPR) repeat protein